MIEAYTEARDLGALPLKSPRLNNREKQGKINIAIGLETGVHDSVLGYWLIRPITSTDDSVPLRVTLSRLTEPQRLGPTSKRRLGRKEAGICHREAE